MKFLSLSSGGVCGSLRQAERLSVSQLVVINSNRLRSSRSRGRWLDHRSLPCSEMRNVPLLQSLALSLRSVWTPSSALPRRHPCPRTAPLQSFSPTLYESFFSALKHKDRKDRKWTCCRQITRGWRRRRIMRWKRLGRQCQCQNELRSQSETLLVFLYVKMMVKYKGTRHIWRF